MIAASAQLDCVVIGAGVVGLAVARSMAMAGREVVVLERENHIGMHSSSRNSEVIHAGLYYPDPSLKAKFCVAGKSLLYAYCEEKHIPFQRIGKLLIASGEDEAARLQAIRAQAQRNGVHDLVPLDASQVKEIEPAVTCTQALLSPSTGIIDSHALMVALQSDIEALQGHVLCNSEVSDVGAKDDGFHIRLESIDNEEFVCRTLINCAGHDAQAIAGMIGCDNSPPQFLAKGHYFAYQGASPFNHLIYPLPTDGGLGIHATNDLAGVARFGPDVSWVDALDYDFDESRKDKFVQAIRRYFPSLDDAKLQSAYVGVRPKLAAAGQADADFAIHGEAEHGVAELINLYGIDSPGLTSSMAIADHVQKLLN